jgi:hypothetical protein
MLTFLSCRKQAISRFDRLWMGAKATLRLQSAGSSMTALNWEPDSSAAFEKIHCSVRFHGA